MSPSRPMMPAADLLVQAARVLQTHQPAFKAEFWSGGERYLARFDFPGIVTVYDRQSGNLLARSLPGRPSHLARGDE